jgi:hypothetical protein
VPEVIDKGQGLFSQDSGLINGFIGTVGILISRISDIDKGTLGYMLAKADIEARGKSQASSPVDSIFNLKTTIEDPNHLIPTCRMIDPLPVIPRP